jgi:hypothetical protein
LQRRKLALLPRSDRTQESAHTPPPSATESKPKSNPFGAARPVDTDSALKKAEEKMAKEKDHQEEVTAIRKGSVDANQPTSPTGPRPEKTRNQPKQLLRRTSAQNNAAGAATATPQSDTDDVTAKLAKLDTHEEAKAEVAESTWRKVDHPAVPAAAPAPADEEPGWETVPTRTKKINGVGKASK